MNMTYVTTQQVENVGEEGMHFPPFEGLYEGEQLKAKALLMKYCSLFAKTDLDVGCTNLITHEIPLLDETRVCQPYRCIHPSQYEVVRAHTKQLLDSQIIRESSSSYSSPIVLVKKRDGGLRMCVLSAVKFKNQKIWVGSKISGWSCRGKMVFDD